ncbi:helix-turn-helix domain-containing protein [Treponema zioleckii]|uniref:helix-turn-helix domain-containing protein n=1 Tax=Treponema zioleckii TaxID=331680 RepID=UPI00168B265F|nr:helix-turn-helix domain-containing protein [Treponema zioleckii]
MKIVFACRSFNMASELSMFVAEENDECALYEDAVGLMLDLKSGKVAPDIMIFDVRFFNECIDYFFDSKNKKGDKIPIVFFNDPFGHNAGRVSRWINRLISRCGMDYCDYDRVSCFFPLLNRLNDYVEKRGIENFTVCVSDSGEKTCNGADKTFELERLTLESNLTPVLNNLLQFFILNKNRDVSLSEITEYMGENSKLNLSSVYSYISRVRKLLKNGHFKNFKIIRTNKGKYRLVTVVDSVK